MKTCFEQHEYIHVGFFYCNRAQSIQATRLLMNLRSAEILIQSTQHSSAQ